MLKKPPSPAPSVAHQEDLYAARTTPSSAFEGYSFRIRLPPPVLTRLDARLAHARLRTHPRHRSVVAAGSCAFVLLCGAPQTGTPYRRYWPRNQSRGSWRSPASRRRGACLLIPRTLVFRDGYPSTSRRCESRRISLPRTGNPCLFHPRSRGDKGALPVGDSHNATRGTNVWSVAGARLPLVGALATLSLRVPQCHVTLHMVFLWLARRQRPGFFAPG